MVFCPVDVTSSTSNRSRSVTSADPEPSGRNATLQPRSTFAMSRSYAGIPPVPVPAVRTVTALLAAEALPSGSRALTVNVYCVVGAEVGHRRGQRARASTPCVAALVHVVPGDAAAVVGRCVPGQRDAVRRDRRYCADSRSRRWLGVTARRGREGHHVALLRSVARGIEGTDRDVVRRIGGQRVDGRGQACSRRRP